MNRFSSATRLSLWNILFASSLLQIWNGLKKSRKWIKQIIELIGQKKKQFSIQYLQTESKLKSFEISKGWLVEFTEFFYIIYKSKYRLQFERKRAPEIDRKTRFYPIFFLHRGFISSIGANYNSKTRSNSRTQINNSFSFICIVQIYSVVTASFLTRFNILNSNSQNYLTFMLQSRSILCIAKW